MNRLCVLDACIEVTRRCNMRCAHCLRGEPENVDMKEEYVSALFERVSYISPLTLTGGEPSLKPTVINMIIRQAKKHSVEIGSFYIVTNGKKVSDSFMLAICKLHCYCNDNEISGIRLSTDEYHEEVNLREVRKLEVFSFFEKHNDKLKYSVIDEGRANDNGLGVRSVRIEGYEIENYTDEYDSVEGMVYLNCEGNIISCCDLSYGSQRENVVCAVEELSVGVLEGYEP